MEILTPILVLGSLGVVFGALLGVAAKALRVDKDERISQVQELLSGANCGGCGYAGCAAFAEAVVNGEADPSLCSGTSEENIRKIAEILGVEVKSGPRMIARVLCSGTCQKAVNNARYEGIYDCIAAARFGGGEKACSYGCMGYGSCAGACPFGAISVNDGVARVDETICTGCGVCVATCPRKVIELVPAAQNTFVLCSSKEKGAAMKNICSAGCIGCKICEKNCPEDAIHVTDNVAHIDYDKCTGCGICAEKCPKKIIGYRKA
ncbi:MAG: RnfABCDGE type electron transport complex subunit B [Clostridia bacterium]|nr:RnfABCDGE type electron transport complex subunit B [Clostridia bacterium]